MIWNATKCIVCHSSKMITFQKKKFDISSPSNWVAHSTLELLGEKECLASYKFCSICNHFFRDPLYTDSLLYTENASQVRSKAYKKYTGGDYNAEAVLAVEGNFKKGFEFTANQLIKQAHIAKRISKKILKQRPGQKIKILDYGAGAGYFIDIYELLFSKVLCFKDIEFYGYDLGTQEAATTKSSKGAKFIVDAEELKKVAPFDVICCSDVLEHIADPVEFTKHINGFLKENGTLFLEVPLELNALREQTGPSFHISCFTKNSLRMLLVRSGFSKISVYSDAFSSYRGASCSTIQAVGVKLNTHGSFYFPRWCGLFTDLLKSFTAGVVRILTRKIEKLTN